VSQPPGASPNAFSVVIGPTASVAPAFLHATVNYAGASNPCAQPAAVCAGNIHIDDRQLIGVANAGANDVTLYVAGASAPLTTIELGAAVPQALTFDVLGDLFVADQPASVTEYVPPYVSSPTTIGNGVNHPQALTVDAHGNLFVANGNASNTVTVYSPPYNGPPETTIAAGIDDPVNLALDPNANLYVVNQANNTVAIYAPPYSGAPTILSKGLNAPNSLALDAHGNLFVANLNSTPNSVVEFSPPFGEQSAPVVTITDGVNEQGTIGVGGSTNLFVPNEGANTVTEYVAPYTKAPVTISGGESQPVALAIDAAANLYVANLGNNTVTQYAAPYGSGTWSAISTGISQPIAIALSPSSGMGAALVP
jgi:sugar lactone lactonase YvrE